MNEYIAHRKIELAKNIPYYDGVWNIQNLYEYLVEVNYNRTENIALKFFDNHLADSQLAGILLREFLLNDYYEGSESQPGAAVILRKMDKCALKANKNLVLMAQKNEVYWKRIFDETDNLEWLS